MAVKEGSSSSSSSSSSTDSAPRRRRATAPRTRTGCLTCKQRHVRCDETRPMCNANKTCTYKAPDLPLRERRIQPAERLPGQMDPWVVTTTGGQQTSHKSRGPAAGCLAKLVPGRRADFDPFDMMACSMPYNSKKLLYYFHHANASLVKLPRDQLQDCLVLASPDTNALRGTLLLATLHYVWNTGDKETFKSAMYFHKVESIATINNSLSKRNYMEARRDIRLICTLAVSEACFGNVNAAQTHMGGLFAAVDELDRSLGHPRGDRKEYNLDEELTERHFLSSVMFIYFLIQHIKDMASDVREEQTQQCHQHPIGRSETYVPRTTCPICFSSDNHESANLSLIQNGHKTETDGLKRRLETIRMLPYFFTPLPEHIQRLEPVDVAPIIAGLRQMTRDVDLMRKEESATGKRCHRGKWLWEKSSATNVWCAMNGAHAESLAKGARWNESGSHWEGANTDPKFPSDSSPSSLSSSTTASPAFSTTPGSSYHPEPRLLPPRPISGSWTAFNAATGVCFCAVLNLVDLDHRFLRRAVIDISSEIYNPVPSDHLSCASTETAGLVFSELEDDGIGRVQEESRDDEADVQLWVTFMGFVGTEMIAPHVSAPPKGASNSRHEGNTSCYAWSICEFEDLRRNLRARLRCLIRRETNRNGGCVWSWTEARERLERTVWFRGDREEMQQQGQQQQGLRWEEVWNRAIDTQGPSAHAAL